MYLVHKNVYLYFGKLSLWHTQIIHDLKYTMSFFLSIEMPWYYVNNKKSIIVPSLHWNKGHLLSLTGSRMVYNIWVYRVQDEVNVR